jgi:hypothetical protein
MNRFLFVPALIAACFLGFGDASALTKPQVEELLAARASGGTVLTASIKQVMEAEIDGGASAEKVVDDIIGALVDGADAIVGSLVAVVEAAQQVPAPDSSSAKPVDAAVAKVLAYVSGDADLMSGVFAALKASISQNVGGSFATDIQGAVDQAIATGVIDANQETVAKALASSGLHSPASSGQNLPAASSGNGPRVSPGNRDTTRDLLRRVPTMRQAESADSPV